MRIVGGEFLLEPKDLSGLVLDWLRQQPEFSKLLHKLPVYSVGEKYLPPYTAVGVYSGK